MGEDVGRKSSGAQEATHKMGRQDRCRRFLGDDPDIRRIEMLPSWKGAWPEAIWGA